MSARLDRLGVQTLLFVVCGFITLIAAVAVGWDTLNTVRVQTENAILLRLFDGLEATYEARTILQQVELLERQYVRSPDFFLIDEMEGYRIQLDTFLRKASLKAESAEEKMALYHLEQSGQDYEETFLALVQAVSAGDDAEVIRFVALSGEQMGAMEEQIDVLTYQSRAAFAETDEKMLTRDITTLVVTCLGLVSFVLLAIATARIIDRRVNRPVLLLSEAAGAVTRAALAGEPVETDSERLAPGLHDLAQREDELGQLARAFLHMEDAIRLRHDDLERQADQIRAKIDPSPR